jgi:hypothetical protein
MTEALPRTSFNSSRLIRLLSDLAIADVAPSNQTKQSFAERLGLWLDVNDAISLSAALNSSPARGSETQSVAPSFASVAMHAEFARVRAGLASSITADGKARIKLPMPAHGASIESAADFSPYRRYYLAHQRNIDSSIGALRTNVRVTLSTLSPAMKRLAALDAVLDEALCVRERTLLSTVPSLLEKRFEHLRKAHQEALADTQAPDAPDLWMQPGAWLAVFCKDMQGVLLAELDVRLQPVMGLVEALGNARPQETAAPFPPAEGGKKTRGGASSSRKVTKQQ